MFFLFAVIIQYSTNVIFLNILAFLVKPMRQVLADRDPGTHTVELEDQTEQKFGSFFFL